MNNYLVNLIQRGAGLGPWSAVGPPAAKPDFIAGSCVGDCTEHRLAVRSEASERLPPDSPLAIPSWQPVSHPVEDHWPRRHSETMVETLPSMETATNPVAPFREKNPPPATADEGVPGNREPSMVLHPRQPAAPDNRRHSDDAAEFPSEKSDHFHRVTRQLDRHPQRSDRPEIRTTRSALLASEWERGFFGKQQSLPEIPADSELEDSTQSDDNLRPLTILRRDRPIQNVDPICNPSQASSVQTFESGPSAQSDEKANRQVPPKIQLAAEHRKPRLFAAPSESHPQLMAGVKAASVDIPRNGASRSEYPASDPPVQVRIGRVEVRAAPAQHKAPSQPRPPAPKGGFGEYYAIRNYEFSE